MVWDTRLWKKVSGALRPGDGEDVDLENADLNNVRKATIDSLNDAQDDQAWESLREVGYEVGDFVPLITHNTGSSSNDFTSNTYSNYSIGSFEFRMQYDSLAPRNGTLAFLLIVDRNPNTDQVDTRVLNAKDGETVLEETGRTSRITTAIGPVEYTPTTTADSSIYRVQARNGDNATTVTLQDPTLQVGVIL